MLSHTARRTLCGIAVAALAFACGGTTTEQIVGPTTSRCQVSVTSPPSAIPAAGSSVSLNISTARDCTWTATTEAAWLTVSPSSGQGSGSVAIAVAANALVTPRTSGVAINDVRVTIDQQGVPCRFELGDQSARVGAAGGRTPVRVLTVDGCEWRASSSVEWVRVLTPTGTGSGLVDLELSRNEAGERSTDVSIAGLSFSLFQESSSGGPGGAPGPSPNPSPPGSTSCSYSIDPERSSFRWPAVQGSVRVVTQAGCSWTASTGTSWISVQRSSGSGSEAVAYQVSANSSTTSDRSGSIDVAGRTHRVTQQACELTIESGHPHLPPESGTYDFRVTTGDGCTWTASSPDSWINVTSTRGTGSGRVFFQLQMNADRGRDGTIVVSGRVKPITQYGSL